MAVLVGAAFIYLGAQTELERNLKSWMTMALLLLTALLVLFWFIFLSRFPGRVRLSTAIVAVVGWFVFVKTIRVDGSVDGRGLPRLAWKWSPPARAPEKAALPVAANTSDVAVPAGAADVPQFYGPKRDGIVTGANLATDWKASAPKLLWKQPVGVGWSAYAVVGGRAYTQEQSGEDELVTCYELVSGKLLWSHANHVRFVEWQGGDGPRATPTIDGGHLFAMGATGILDCLDATTGKLIWSRDVLKENNAKNITWGISSSPLVYDDRVVVTAGEGSASILAFKKDTGELLWKSGTDKACYASPVLATLAGKRAVVSLNAGSFTLTDAASGELMLEEKWKPAPWPKAAQPAIIEGDRIFFTAGYGYGCVMFQIKAADGKLSANELWANNKMKAQFNSVTFHKGFIYGLDDGSLACVDAATGERKWKEGRFGSGQTLLVDETILILSEQGAVVLAEAKADGYHELGRFDAIKGKTWNHPVLAGRYLLVRNDQAAACFELPVNAAVK